MRSMLVYNAAVETVFEEYIKTDSDRMWESKHGSFGVYIFLFCMHCLLICRNLLQPFVHHVSFGIMALFERKFIVIYHIKSSYLTIFCLIYYIFLRNAWPSRLTNNAKWFCLICNSFL